VIAPVVIKAPLTVTSLSAKDIKSISVTSPISPLLFKSTPPKRPLPITSSSYPGRVVPIPSLDVAISQNRSFEPDCSYSST